VGPDLTGSWASLSYSRSILSGSFEIKNLGNQKASAFVTRIYLSNDGITLGTLIAKSSLSYLNAAQSKRISLKYYAARLSGKYVIAVVDANNSVAESTEENNRISARIP
jgi:subtilase family serine protease